eukprot:g11545.t1
MSADKVAVVLPIFTHWRAPEVTDAWAERGNFMKYDNVVFDLHYYHNFSSIWNLLSHRQHVDVVACHALELKCLPHAMVGEWSTSRPGQFSEAEQADFARQQVLGYNHASHGWTEPQMRVVLAHLGFFGIGMTMSSTPIGTWSEALSRPAAYPSLWALASCRASYAQSGKKTDGEDASDFFSHAALCPAVHLACGHGSWAGLAMHSSFGESMAEVDQCGENLPCAGARCGEKEQGVIGVPGDNGGLSQKEKQAAPSPGPSLRRSETLTKDVSQFPTLARKVSECKSALQPGQMAGDLGWISKGTQDPALEEAVFSLEVNALSDLVTTSRGVHIVQRYA